MSTSQIIAIISSLNDFSMPPSREASIFTVQNQVADPSYKVTTNTAGFTIKANGNYRVTVLLRTGATGGNVMLYQMPPSPGPAPIPGSQMTLPPNSIIAKSFPFTVHLVCQLELLTYGTSSIDFLKSSMIILEKLS